MNYLEQIAKLEDLVKEKDVLETQLKKEKEKELLRLCQQAYSAVIEIREEINQNKSVVEYIARLPYQKLNLINENIRDSDFRMFLESNRREVMGPSYNCPLIEVYNGNIYTQEDFNNTIFAILGKSHSSKDMYTIIDFVKTITPDNLRKNIEKELKL
jgi:hypothetical protein